MRVRGAKSQLCVGRSTHLEVTVIKVIVLTSVYF